MDVESFRLEKTLKRSSPIPNLKKRQNKQLNRYIFQLSSLQSYFFKACFNVFLVLEAQAVFMMSLVGDA